MSVTAYKDQAKTIQLQETSYFLGDGTTSKFMALHDVAAVYIDNVKTTGFRKVDNYVIFDSPPVSNALIILVPTSSLDLFLPNDQIADIIESIYIDSDEDAYILSEDVTTGEVGSLLFSLDNIAFVACLEVSLGVSIRVYIKASSTDTAGDIKTLASSRIVVVDSSTPLDTNGNITISFSVPGGSFGGVEIYEELM